MLCTAKRLTLYSIRAAEPIPTGQQGSLFNPFLPGSCYCCLATQNEISDSLLIGPKVQGFHLSTISPEGALMITVCGPVTVNSWGEGGSKDSFFLLCHFLKKKG